LIVLAASSAGHDRISFCIYNNNIYNPQKQLDFLFISTHNTTMTNKADTTYRIKQHKKGLAQFKRWLDPKLFEQADEYLKRISKHEPI